MCFGWQNRVEAVIWSGVVRLDDKWIDCKLHRKLSESTRSSLWVAVAKPTRNSWYVDDVSKYPFGHWPSSFKVVSLCFSRPHAAPKKLKMYWVYPKKVIDNIVYDVPYLKTSLLLFCLAWTTTSNSITTTQKKKYSTISSLALCVEVSLSGWCNYLFSFFLLSSFALVENKITKKIQNVTFNGQPKKKKKKTRPNGGGRWCWARLSECQSSLILVHWIYLGGAQVSLRH